MRTVVMMYRSPIFVFLVIAGLCGALWLGSGKTKSQSKHLQPKGNGVTVSNHTQAFQVVNATNDGNTIQLSLRNGYSKAITAFIVSGDDGSSVQVDFSSVDSLIAPGETYNYGEATANLLSHSGAEQSRPKISILAVLFEDGSSDGDNKVVRDIKNRRLGEKIQLMRILPLLEEALGVEDSELPVSIERLKARISALPDKPQKGESPEIMGGLHHGKQYIYAKLERLKQLQDENDVVNLRTELTKIKHRYKKETTKL